MGIRFRFGKKVAFLKGESAVGLPKLGNLIWSLRLAERFKSAPTFRVAAVGFEGDAANCVASWVPTIDVRPVEFNTAGPARPPRGAARARRAAALGLRGLPTLEEYLAAKEAARRD